MEKLIFPMKVMNITQGVNGALSHRGTNAIDNAGKDTGIDEVYAPCTMKCVYKDNEKNGNACFFESTEKVQFANGSIDFASFLFIHDNDINDIKIGEHFSKGQVVYQEGTAGKATGNHVHIEVKRGAIPKNANRYPYDLNGYGVYSLPDNIHPASAFFVDGVIIKNGYDYQWKTTKEKISSWESHPNGKWKYRRDGALVKNSMVWDSEYQAWYAFDKDGWMLRSTFVQDAGKWVYVAESGKMEKGCTLKFNANNSGYLERSK